MQRTLAKNRRRDALWEVAERLREMIFCRWQPTRPYDIVLAFMTFPHRIASRRGGSYQRLEGSATAMYAKEMAYQEIKDTRILTTHISNGIKIGAEVTMSELVPGNRTGG